MDLYLDTPESYDARVDVDAIAAQASQEAFRAIFSGLEGALGLADGSIPGDFAPGETARIHEAFSLFVRRAYMNLPLSVRVGWSWDAFQELRPTHPLHVTDLQACDPESLTDADGIAWTITTDADNTSARCPRVDVRARNVSVLADWLEENFGGGDPAFIRETLARATGRTGDYDEAAASDGPGEYVVTDCAEDPSRSPLWLGLADNPVDALNRYAVAEGFAPYDADPSMRESVYCIGSEPYGAETIGAGAPFTNYEIAAFKVRDIRTIHAESPRAV